MLDSTGSQHHFLSKMSIAGKQSQVITMPYEKHRCSIQDNGKSMANGSSRCLPWFNGSSVILKVSAEKLGARVYPRCVLIARLRRFFTPPSHSALSESNHASNTFLKTIYSQSRLCFMVPGVFIFLSPLFLLLCLRLQPPRSSHLSTSGAAASQAQRHQGFPFIW